MKKIGIPDIALKTSAIVATAISLFYIITLDSITNFWQYAICFACLVYLIFVLCIKWDAIIRTIEQEEADTEIIDLDKKRRAHDRLE